MVSARVCLAGTKKCVGYRAVATMRLSVMLLGTLCAIAPLSSYTCLVAEEIVPRGAPWKFLEGRKEASLPDPSAWRQIDFDDSAWALRPMPLFYGEPLFGTELPDMRGNYSSVFLRRKFVVENLSEISHILLEALSDDGFVAWINGREV